jgi:molybdopterin synthase sulfur carrier subunit
MLIKLRYFASVREQLGTSEESLEVPVTVRTIGELRRFLRERGAAWEEALGEGRALRMACDQRMADADAPLADGCEVAFFPPVTGG